MHTAIPSICSTDKFVHVLVHHANDGVQLALHGVPQRVQLPQGPLLGGFQVAMQSLQASFQCPTALLFGIDKVDPFLWQMLVIIIGYCYCCYWLCSTSTQERWLCVRISQASTYVDEESAHFFELLVFEDVVHCWRRRGWGAWRHGLMVAHTLCSHVQHHLMSDRLMVN